MQQAQSEKNRQTSKSSCDTVIWLTWRSSGSFHGNHTMHPKLCHRDFTRIGLARHEKICMHFAYLAEASRPMSVFIFSGRSHAPWNLSALSISIPRHNPTTCGSKSDKQKLPHGISRCLRRTMTEICRIGILRNSKST